MWFYQFTRPIGNMSEKLSANISEEKLSKLMSRIKNDRNLASKLGLLEDVPPVSLKRKVKLVSN